MAKAIKEKETLRQKDASVLRKELAEVRVALQKARVDLAFGRLPKTSQVSELRKQVARLETILKEKESTNA